MRTREPQTCETVYNENARPRTCADHALSGILDVEAVVVEGAERADDADQDRHGMRIALEACRAGGRACVSGAARAARRKASDVPL